MLVYMPQDGHCLASFDAIPPPKKLVFPRPTKWKFPTETGMRTPTLEIKSQTPFFFGCFVENSVTPLSTLANNKRSCSKKWKQSGQNCVFPVFPAKILWRFCHAVLDFREHQGLPPDYKSTTPDQLRWRTKTDDEDFPGFWPILFSNIVKKSFF